MTFDGPGGKRTATLMQRRHSIITNNAQSMKEKAYRHGYGRKVSVRLMHVIDMVIHLQARDAAEPAAEELNEHVRLTNECARPTARNDIKRAVDWGMLSEYRDGAFTRYCFDPEQHRKICRVLSWIEIIPQVLLKQLAEPFNPDAGSDLLPPEVYHNAIRVYGEKQ